MAAVQETDASEAQLADIATLGDLWRPLGRGVSLETRPRAEQSIGVRVALHMGRRSSHPSSGLAGAAAITLGLYVGVGGCFAAGLYWLLQPRVIANPGLAAYKPPPKTMVTYAGSPGAWTPPPPTVVAATTDGDVVEITAAAPKTEAAKRQAVASPRARRPRPQRRDPMRDYAYQAFGFRPWF
jgi:hypothetical protein